MAETAIAPGGRKQTASKTITAVKISHLPQQQSKRFSSEIAELDRVLGGGIVAGQVILFAGEPGIGKSTLLTQLALKLSAKEKTNNIYYICGEESPFQVSLRVNRLGKKNDRFLLLPETNVDAIVDFLKQQPSPRLVIIDSIQTLTTNDLGGVAGSIGQVRESAQRLIEWAKRAQVPVLLVGHITKQGAIAGPKVLEHAVDSVIYFEGERRQDLRILRVTKNRFGPTDEIGIFKMTAKGLFPANQRALVETMARSRIGSAVTVVSEGTRMIAVEIQALVSHTFTPLPKRIITGLDRNRAEMLIAVTQKQLHLPLFKYDIYINVAGGIKVTEPAADLAACAAVFSSFKNKPLPPKSCFIGEVSLLGEISNVSQLEKEKNKPGV